MDTGIGNYSHVRCNLLYRDSYLHAWVYVQALYVYYFFHMPYISQPTGFTDSY